MSGSASGTVVVGAGVMGCSVAWHLAEAGDPDVLVVDGHGIGSGATSIQPGGIRTLWASPVSRRLAKESIEFYRGAKARLGVPVELGFDPCGYLFVASTESSLEQMRNEAAEYSADGIACELVTPEQIAELVEGMDTSEVLGGLYGTSDGYLAHPGAPVALFAEAAKQRGVRFEDRQVSSVAATDQGVEIRFADGDVLPAARAVVCAGAASRELLGLSMSELPLTAEPKYLFYSNRVPGQLIRPLVIFPERSFAAKHLADGSVLVSDLHLGSAGTEVDEDAARRDITSRARDLFPILEHVRYPVMVTGSYDVTPDAQPLLGRIGDTGRLWIGAGMNGRGMMMAPALGRRLAAAIDGDVEAIPEELDANRPLIATERLVRESRVI